tara:strand:- start:2099 stop:2338 length:240 start_codon:yes stop_codon:yes gene_type:complete
VATAHLRFDHHESEGVRNEELLNSINYILSPNAPFAARVVYDHFGDKEKFPRIDDEMMNAVDKADTAQFTMEDVLMPNA